MNAYILFVFNFNLRNILEEACISLTAFELSFLWPVFFSPLLCTSRRLTDSVQALHPQPQGHSEALSCTLPPQGPLQAWLGQGRTLATQSVTLLQQLVWMVQCCPEDLQQRAEVSSCRQHTLRCPSPLAPHRQPKGCLMRKGDATWSQLNQHLKAMLEEAQSLKAQLDAVVQPTSETTLLTW